LSNLDQLEEMLKGNSKQEFVGVLREYHQAKPGAESALSILDEALQVKLSTKQPLGANSSTEMDALASDSEAFTDQAETSADE